MKFKKAAAFMLAAAIAVMGMAGCGNKDAANTESSKNTEITESQKNEDSTSSGELVLTEDGVTEKGVFPIVPEKITLTAVVVQYPYISDMKTNEFTQWLEEITNIHLDMTVVPEEGLKDKLNLMLSTGDYPDIIMTGAASNNRDVVKYGMSEKIYIPLNEYIDKYSENLVARWEEMPEIKEGMTAPDGNIYVLPTFEGYTGHGAIDKKQWVNKGWLDNLGMEVPTTIEEYYDMLVAFKNEDPNGNGKQDEIPLTGAYGTWAAEPYLFILNAFDYYDESLVKLKDGTFSSTADTDGFKEGLKFLNKLYAEGLLDPASLTQDLNQLVQVTRNEDNIVGAYSAGHIAMGIDYTNKDVFENWTYILPLKGPNGYQGIPVSDKQTINGGPFAITDKCKNPAAAFRLADMLFGDLDSYVQQNWYKGRTWEDPTPGSKGITGLDARFRQIPAPEGQTQTSFDWGTASCRGWEKNHKLYLEFTGDIKDPVNYEAYLIQVTEEYKKYASEYEQQMPTWNDVETSEKLSNMITPIQDYVKTSIVDFITGNKNVDKDWQEYLDGLKQLGYYEYIQLKQDTYFK